MKRIYYIFLVVFAIFLIGCKNTSVNTTTINENSSSTTTNKNKLTVSFDTDEGSIIEPIILNDNIKIVKPDDPTKAGFTFAGWYLNDTLWDFENDIPTESITLTAHWKSDVLYEVFEGELIICGLSTDKENIIINESYEGLPVTEIREYAFGQKKTIKSITLPNSIKVIGDSAFEGCISLETINLPDTIVSIRKRSFYNCKSLKTIALPSNITSIENYTFCGNQNLESITFNEKMNKIGEYAFQDCSSLKTIDIEVFMGCASLENLVIPNSVTDIKKQAFYDSGIKYITLPESLNSIYVTALRECMNLKYIYIPKGSLAHFKKIMEPEFHSKLKEK